jgi:SynChlorMet cassette protein ScmC
MFLSYNFHLDCSVKWAFEASGPAEGWLKNFALAMGLSAADGKADRRVHFEFMPRRPGEFFGPHLLRCARAVRTRIGTREWKLKDFPDMAFFEHPDLSEIICEIASDGPAQVHQMRRAMLPVYTHSLISGGLPVHGALVEMNGSGIILAGRSGVGKSTACRRLSPPWRVLGDDLCLVVRDVSGSYRVHPLPTWSAIREKGGPRLCTSGASVPLRAIFFLQQAPRDTSQEMKKSMAAVSLTASTMEVFRSVDPLFPTQEEAGMKKALYDNAASIAMAVPACILRISLTGCFWEKIETLLETGDRLLFQCETRGRKMA